ncbi:hypothetical protein P7A61_04180 [Clostridium perfringens]|nr:hypothetical protein [Clostridium perfringens]
MAESYFDSEGYEYTKSNHRMRYNAELHYNHGKPWTVKELSYLCKMRPCMKYKDLSLALGRTVSVCMSKIYELKKKNLIGFYKSLDL